MHQIFQKEMDGQGRIILPREWRQKLRSNKVIVVMEDLSLRVLPEPKKLSSFFDKAKQSRLKPDPFEDYAQSLAEASLS